MKLLILNIISKDWIISIEKFSTFSIYRYTVAIPTRGIYSIELRYRHLSIIGNDSDYTHTIIKFIRGVSRGFIIL